MTKFKDVVKAIFRINKNVIKKEFEEIQNLTPTEEDYAQGERLAEAAVVTMSSMGLAYTVLGQRIMAKVFAYGIRDIKDGVEDNSKLIIGRVIEEIKNERSKGKEEEKQQGTDRKSTRLNSSHTS